MQINRFRSRGVCVQDTRLMKSAGTTSISQALRGLTVSAFGTGLMLWTSPVLTGLVVACLPVLLAGFQVFARLNKRYTREGLSASAAASVVSEETFGSVRTVRPSCFCTPSSGLVWGQHAVAMVLCGASTLF